jgi:hypothetical protein
MPPETAIPSPAVVAQSAVQRLPRWGLLGLCLAYIVAGFAGRLPWKTADITTFGLMRAIASGDSPWMQPQLLGFRPEIEALLPYWLGAGAISLFGPWLDAFVAVRIPYVLLLALTFYATWNAVYHLARQPAAQPVAFAFGGEANPVDYARALADAGLLALMACLGLPLLSHEVSPALCQLAFSTLMLYAVAAMPWRTVGPLLALTLATEGLVLSGAPILAVAWCLAGAFIHSTQPSDRCRRWALVLIAFALTSGIMAWAVDVWRWRFELPDSAQDIKYSLQMLAWFGWPALPLGLWALWRWRKLWWHSRTAMHLAWPLAFGLVGLVAWACLHASQRTLLVTLPAWATLAAFALPTLKRTVSALIDWFTLLFFTGCAIVIWVVWISLQTGFPAQPARNVLKLAPGFVHQFQWLPLLFAVVATLAWVWLVRWRVGRHRAALWKSLVLPAGGAALAWVLVMSLWLPLLNHTRSYVNVVRKVSQAVTTEQCLLEYGLSPGMAAAFQYHGNFRLYRYDSGAPCNTLIVNTQTRIAFDALNLLEHWKPIAKASRNKEDTDGVLIYRRAKP